LKARYDCRDRNFRPGVILLAMQHYMRLQRNLIYTGITLGQDNYNSSCPTRPASATATMTNTVARRLTSRYTKLAHAIARGSGPE
jgi:hypothetical protein